MTVINENEYIDKITLSKNIDKVIIDESKILKDKASKYLKDNGYTFEEIEWIKKWIEEFNKWETISKAEMKEFISNEIFSKRTA